jgi:hypothetical protein
VGTGNVHAKIAQMSFTNQLGAAAAKKRKGKKSHFKKAFLHKQGAVAAAHQCRLSAPGLAAVAEDMATLPVPLDLRYHEKRKKKKIGRYHEKRKRRR